MKRKRRAWSRPELIVLVRSRPEEAVLAVCKISGGYTGPAAGNCARPAPGCFAISTS